ncbi:heat shock protein domain protein [Moniliophthora roreri MCA 2997]|uniref:Heat shock protein domain protein n=1 Tax=Moniliophthora roreri (strain MCA 2997) TaxID=1381753 RepID=V2XKE1_MONRO|nr:heat shock protein domain protein [Moniliophthora roreri MCA 2997]
MFPTLTKNGRCTHHLRSSRLFSTTAKSSNPFPFPSQARPTPHQIFHLPPGASQEQIKERYYELVRLYHPDKLSVSNPSEAEVAHSRFQAISNAYNILRGKSTSTDGGADATANFRYGPDSQYATTAARRAMHLRRHKELYEAGAVDDRWKDRLILFGVAAAVVTFVVQAMLTRREALAEAMDRSRFSRVGPAREQNRPTEKLDEDPRLAALSDEETTDS